MRIVFTVAPIVMGVDKFFNVLVNWEICLAPRINDIAVRDFGLMVGALTLARLARRYDRPGWEVGL